MINYAMIINQLTVDRRQKSISWNIGVETNMGMKREDDSEKEEKRT